MNTGQRSARRIVSVKAPRDTICISCQHRLSAASARRHASATAAATSEETSSVETSSPMPPVAAATPRKAFRLICSPILSRPPLLTRELTSFEKAFYLYQKRLNERLSLPFTRYFYYKKGTPADMEWKRKAKARRGVAARDVGLYNAYAVDGWNDEVLIGSRLGEPEDIYNKLVRDAEGKDIVDPELQGDTLAGGSAVSGDSKAVDGVREPVGEVVIDKPLPRRTEADKCNDLRSLNRKLDRSLYLLIKREDGSWRFPEDRVYGRENLNQAAERIILQAGGVNMNTWIVGNHPIGHYTASFEQPVTKTVPPNRLVGTSRAEMELEEYGEKVFFMKARVMAGQADISKNEFGDTEFQWLAKEEIKEKIQPQNSAYWQWIKNILTER